MFFRPMFGPGGLAKLPMLPENWDSALPLLPEGVLCYNQKYGHINHDQGCETPQYRASPQDIFEPMRTILLKI